MDKIKMNLQDLQIFLEIFIPEESLHKKHQTNELRYITSKVLSALDSINCSTDIEMLFKAFVNLSYPIAVKEPLKKEINENVYIETNCHAIFIGINSGKLKTLKSTLQYFQTGKSKLLQIQQDFLSDLLTKSSQLPKPKFEGM